MKIKGTEDKQEVEILKAVAQAWHGRNSSSATQDSSSDGEFDARRRNFKTKPTRFRMEAINYNVGRTRRRSSSSSCNNNNAHWDFKQSLWDSYEIVSVSKKLESGLLQVDNDPFNLERPAARIPKKESKNSLRNLFNLMSSRRFDHSSIPPPPEKDDL